MSEETNYEPPKVWKWNADMGGTFSKINRPVAGAAHERELPIGGHPLQLYCQGTPNGQKVTILLEEFIEMRISDAEYNAHLMRIVDGGQLE